MTSINSGLSKLIASLLSSISSDLSTLQYQRRAVMPKEAKVCDLSVFIALHLCPVGDSLEGIKIQEQNWH